MRILHCTVALVLMGGLPGWAQTAQPAGSNPAHFTVFLRGTPIGNEEVWVERSGEGTTISGTARLGPPLNLTVRRAQIRYAPGGSPLECTVEGSIQEQLLGIHTVVAGTTATTDSTLGTQSSRKTDQVAANAVLLPNAFFGAYEALAARLIGSKAGDELRGYVPPQAEIAIRVSNATDEAIRTPGGVVRITRFGVQLQIAGKPLDAEIWVGPGGRLVRLVVAAQSLDYARNDIVSVASRREPISHPGDEQIRVLANGFNLEGTLTRPAAAAQPATSGSAKEKPARHPAVILVAGSGETDRDETIAGVPLFGQLASALADAGFIVVRYDRRGVGQSGGRAETAAINDYVEDLRAMVKAVRKRQDVDPKKVSVVGYSEGGPVALAAAQRDDGIRAVALVAAPGTSGADLVLAQQERALARMNIPEAEKQAKIDLQKKINQAVQTGRGWDGVPPAIRKQADTPWFQSLLAFDPARIVPKVRQPLLVVTAALDRQIVPANGQKLEALARARKPREGQTVKLVEIPGVNHLFVPAATGEVDEYGSVPDKTISSQLPAAIAAWLKELR